MKNLMSLAVLIALLSTEATILCVDRLKRNVDRPKPEKTESRTSTFGGASTKVKGDAEMESQTVATEGGEATGDYRQDLTQEALSKYKFDVNVAF